METIHFRLLLLSLVLPLIDASLVVEHTATTTRPLTVQEQIGINFTKNYQTLRHPPTDKVTMTLKLNVYHIESINQTTQSLFLHGDIDMHYIDRRLAWNRTAFPTYLWEPYRDTRFFWTPTLFLFNSQNVHGMAIHCSHKRHVNRLKVYASGYVYCQMEVGLHLTCPMKFDKFPNDKQTCPIAIYDGRYVSDKQTDFEAHLSHARQGVRMGGGTFNQDLELTKAKNVNGWNVVGSSASPQWFTYEYQATEVDADSSVPPIKYIFKMYNNRSEMPNGIHSIAAMVFYVNIERSHDSFSVYLIDVPINIALLAVVAAMLVESIQLSIVACVLSLVTHALISVNLMDNLPPTNEHSPMIVTLQAYALIITFAACVTRCSLVAWIKNTPADDTKVGAARRTRIACNVRIAFAVFILCFMLLAFIVAE